jgi:hypothetical protein
MKFHCYEVGGGADTYGYQVTVDKIDAEQVEGRPRDYYFTVHVTYQKDDGYKMKEEVTGLATCSEQGKIGKLATIKNIFCLEKL